MPLTLRRATAADAPALAPIIVAAFNSIADKHNFPRDFPAPEVAAGMAQMVTGDPRVWGVVAEDGGRIIGSNFLHERDPIVGVGPITVDPGHHAKGVGRALMRAVLQRAAEIDAPGVRLVQDAFNTTSMPLYASVGFDVREPLVLVQGKPVGDLPAGVEGRPMRDADVPACDDLCRRVHGHSRANELRDALVHFKPFVLTRNGHVSAYATCPTTWFLNHGVAESVADMQYLLTAAARANAEPLFFLLPTRQAELFRWCLAHGLRVLKPMTLMTTGQYQEPRGTWYPSVLF
jgi:predicted N-acetyltransferase YhbS